MSAIKDVLSRKLFSQGGLLEPEQGRNTGGILASSQPLMEAARFANGGANFQLGIAPQALYSPESMQEQTPAFDPLDFYDPGSLNKEPAPTVMPPSRNLSLDPSFVSNTDLPRPFDDMTDDDLRYTSPSATAKDRLARDPRARSMYDLKPGEDIRELLSGTEGLSSIAARERAVRADQRADQRADKRGTPLDQVTNALFPSTDDSAAVDPAAVDLTPAAPAAVDLTPSEDNLKEKGSLEDFLANVKTGSISDVDIDALKKKIGKAFDPLEKNPTTEGLLLAELGASIMNKGFKKGVLEGLPKITAYHDSQFKAKQKRKDAVTTLALNQKFKTDDANREISKEDAKQGSITSSYLLLGSTSDWEKNYEKIDMSLSPRYLSAKQATSLSNEGVKVVEIKNSDKLAGLLTGFPTKADTKNTVIKTIEPFKDFGNSSSIDIRVQKTGDGGSSMDKNQAKSLFGIYDSVTLGNRRLKRLLDKVNTFKNEDITGPRASIGEIQQRLITLGAPKKLVEGFTGIASGKAGLAAIEMRILAAELAPILLKESGKTISDADRDRIAEIIGYKKGDSAFGGDVLMEIFLASPEKFQEVKNSLNQALIDQQMALNSQMSSTLMRVGLTFESGGLQNPTVRDSNVFEENDIPTISSYGL